MLIHPLDYPDKASLKSDIETNLAAVDVCEQIIERLVKNPKEY
jgi:hypothetical protein